MKVNLLTSYISKEDELAVLEQKIAAVEEILKTPARTVEDIVVHIQLLKERNLLLHN